MTIGIKKILIALLLVICASAHAQYSEFYIIDSPERYVMGTVLFKDVLLKDAELAKANRVKEMYIQKDGKILTKLLVNSEGYVEDYYTFNEETQAISTHWRFGYGAGNILTSAYYRYERKRINYILSYENNRLASIHCDSNGVESQWDIAYEGDKISKMTWLDLVNDKVRSVIYFNYDKKVVLENISDESGNEMYKIIWKKNECTIKYTEEFSNIYKFDNDRLTERIFKYMMKGDLSTQTYPKEIKTSESYIYDEKGLIKEAAMKSSSPDEKYEFVYNFYE